MSCAHTRTHARAHAHAHTQTLSHTYTHTEVSRAHGHHRLLCRCSNLQGVIARVVKAIDTDGNGKLDFNEFIAAFQIQVVGPFAILAQWCRNSGMTTLQCLEMLAWSMWRQDK